MTLHERGRNGILAEWVDNALTSTSDSGRRSPVAERGSAGSGLPVWTGAATVKSAVARRERACCAPTGWPTNSSSALSLMAWSWTISAEPNCASTPPISTPSTIGPTCSVAFRQPLDGLPVRIVVADMSTRRGTPTGTRQTGGGTAAPARASRTGIGLPLIASQSPFSHDEVHVPSSLRPLPGTRPPLRLCCGGTHGAVSGTEIG